MKNHPTRKLGLVALSSAGALALFMAVGCQETQDDMNARVDETQRDVDSRIDARTASTEAKVDQKTAEADEKVDSAIDRGLDRVLGDN